jgi:pimeloyl-ACP methyl ester carboxylesterase
MFSLDFRAEGPQKRELWGTLTLPEKVKGPAILMAHGFLGFKDWAFFPWLAQTFAQEGFPAIRFNFSGSGMGPQTDGPFEELEAFQNDSVTRQVEDLHTILALAGEGEIHRVLPPQESVFLWGHSRGGAICLLAANSPKIAAVSTWATISRVNRYLYEVKKAWRKQGFSAYESSRTGQILKYSTGFLEDVERWGKEGDLPAYLHRLELPVLLVHGSEDTSVPPEESESLAALHPQARLAILAGADHKFNTSHPFTGPSPSLLEAAQNTLHFYQSLLS